MKQSLRDMIEEDMTCCLTPDLPSLRYLGHEVKVFLWDGLSQANLLRDKLNLSDFSDFQLVSSMATTKQGYIPLHDMGGEVDQEAFLLEDPLDMEYIANQNEDTKEAKALPVRGRVYKVTLDTLVALDWFYENEFSTNRVVIDCKLPYGKDIMCFAWMHDLDHLAEYDPKENAYVIRKEIETLPFLTETHNKEEVYTF